MSASFDDLWEQVNPSNEKHFHLGITRPELEEEYSQEKQPESTKQQSFDDLWEQVNPSRSALEKGARIAGQFAIGAAENAALPYELATMPLASKEAQNVSYRQSVGEDIERLQEQKASGQWDESDQELYDSLIQQMQDTEESGKFAQTMNVGVRGLAEKATGIDLHPEGVLEKAAGWMGFLKDPKKALSFGKDIAKYGLKPSDFKALIPGTNAARSLSAGTALELAEQGQLGPIGTLAAAIAGDVAGHGPKSLMWTVKNPKQAAANITNLVTGKNSKRGWAEQLAKDAKESGIQLDAGTLTQSKLVQFAQARAAQSGLSGSKLDDFRKSLSGQIMKEYESIADNLGEMRFENTHQASEAIRSALKTEEKALNIPFESQQARKGQARSLEGRVLHTPMENYNQNLLNEIFPQENMSTYEKGSTLKEAANDIKRPIDEQFDTRWREFDRKVEIMPLTRQHELANEMTRFTLDNQGSLLLGESTAEARVVNAARNLADRLTAENAGRGVRLSDLIKTKKTLGDVANWEFGGSNFESKYKKLVGDIDSAIERTLQERAPTLLEEFQVLKHDYSQFKDTFENKNVIKLFEPKNNNFNALYHDFVANPDKLRSLEDMLIHTPRGQDLINRVKRDFAESVIERPSFNRRDLLDLESVLGPEFEQELREFAQERQYAQDHPLPRIERPEPLGIQAQAPQTRATNPNRKIKAEETAIHMRRKMYNDISKKTPDQIMKQMDTIQGIRDLKKVLSLTPEGRELFKELSRYKLDEMISTKMKNNLTEQVKLGTFSNLVKTQADKAILKELLGQNNFLRLQRLQKLSGGIAESAEKFLNASKSGTTIGDVGLISAGVMGVFTGNPFLVLNSLAGIGGLRIISNLLADPEYLKLLEEALLTKSSQKFIGVLERMRPNVIKAILDSNESNSKPST